MTITPEQIARLRNALTRAESYGEADLPYADVHVSNSDLNALLDAAEERDRLLGSLDRLYSACVNCSAIDCGKCRDCISKERDRLREKLQRQQEHHLDAMREQDMEASRLYVELLVDWEAADRYAARWKALAKRLRVDLISERRDIRAFERAADTAMTKEDAARAEALMARAELQKVSLDFSSNLGHWAEEEAKLRAELEKVQRERDATEKLLRREYWLGHGCEPGALYGDDGEMQCGRCRLDFRREEISSIARQVASMRRDRVGIALAALDAVGEKGAK